jgi:uncharacterized protein (TIGR03067 family)
LLSAPPAAVKWVRAHFSVHGDSPMRTRTLAALVLGLFLAAAAGADDATKKDLDKLQGTWQTVSGEFNGDKLDEELCKVLKFVCKGDKFEVQGPADILNQYAKGAFKLDATTTPKTLDVTIGGGDKKGDVIESIYELDGDNLKVCGKLVGKERPADFTTKTGSNMVSLVLKREKQ